MAERLLKSSLVLPALEYALKCSHIFNILDSSGSVGVSERTAYVLKVRQLAIAIAQSYVAEEPPAAEQRDLTPVRTGERTES
jgi:glycyl-tRNA synthetase alpha chain